MKRNNKAISYNALENAVVDEGNETNTSVGSMFNRKYEFSEYFMELNSSVILRNKGSSQLMCFMKIAPKDPTCPTAIIPVLMFMRGEYSVKLTGQWHHCKPNTDDLNGFISVAVKGFDNFGLHPGTYRLDRLRNSVEYLIHNGLEGILSDNTDINIGCIDDIGAIIIVSADAPILPKPGYSYNIEDNWGSETETVTPVQKKPTKTKPSMFVVPRTAKPEIILGKGANKTLEFIFPKEDSNVGDPEVSQSYWEAIRSLMEF